MVIRSRRFYKLWLNGVKHGKQKEFPTVKSHDSALTVQTSSALFRTLLCLASLIEDLLGEGYGFVLTSRFQSNSLERRFVKYRKMSGRRFLVDCEM